MANNLNPLFPNTDFAKLPEDLRIGIIIADGMWYDFPKWRSRAKVDEETLARWIDKNLESGKLVRSPTGARSYRFPLESIKQWYNENGFDIEEQLVSFSYPPRIWDNMTENEGFLAAPSRYISIVSFECMPEVADEVKEVLRGIARVREVRPNHYKAYCLDAKMVNGMVDEVFSRYPDSSVVKSYNHRNCRRRELVDFSLPFREGIIQFYRTFAVSLLRRSRETMNIFLPEQDDQDAQIVIWVIEALEKFDEKASTPFAGYLSEVLRRWPIGLPEEYLGKPLSAFQRERSKAIASLKEKSTDGRTNFNPQELANEMKIPVREFSSLEERHHFWLSSRSATTLTWVENSEERYSRNLIEDGQNNTTSTDVELAAKISREIVDVALSTGCYEDAFKVIPEVNSSAINPAALKDLSPTFVTELGTRLGMS